MSARVGVSTAALAVLWLGAASPVALAQGTGRSMDIDVSVRSAAMGGASTAVFWGEELNHWGNPALLGSLNGLRYETGRTQLVPVLATDVRFDTRTWKGGHAGLGVFVSRAPERAGGVYLDYGVSQGTDPFGNPTPAFRSYEAVDSWGAGVSAAALAANLYRWSGREPPALLRFVDVSAGMSFKFLEMVLAPVSLGAGGTDARDAGVLVRVTPIDGLATATGAPVRVDLAWGHSWLSYNDDARVRFLTEDARVSRHRRSGFAGRFAATVPGFPARAGAGALVTELLRGLTPLVSLGLAKDHSVIDGGDGTFAYETDGYGMEVVLANLLTYRHGHHEDLVGGIDGATWGWAIALPVGPWAEVRYEQGRFPQCCGLADLDRRATAFWVDPVAIWRSTHAAR